MKKAYFDRAVSLLLACLIAFPAGMTALADDTGTTESAGASNDVVMASDGSRFDTEGRFVVDSAEALMALSDYCSLDSRSDGLRVIVTKDISLVGVDFEPIPYFAGSFDGGEHTISGLVIDDGYSPAGLFSRVAEGASAESWRPAGSARMSAESSDRTTVSSCAAPSPETSARRPLSAASSVRTGRTAKSTAAPPMVKSQARA